VCTSAEFLAVRDQNLDLSIKLLARRTLAGDSSFAEEIDREFVKLLATHKQQLAQRIISLTRARHAKYENTPSHRQPDVLHGPGGLQDLRLISTLDKLFTGQAESTLEQSAAFLSFVLCFLRYRANEAQNVLDLAAQEAIASQFADGEKPDVWMRQYFAHARRVFNAARRMLDLCEASSGTLLEGFHEWQSRLSNADFSVLNGRLYLRNPAALDGDPETVFHLLEFVARHGIPPSPETEQRLQMAKDAVARFCRQPRPLWPIIKSILSLPRVPYAIRVLQHADLLSSIFPEWARIEGATRSNSDHAYTIDEHTLMALERICNLPGAGDPIRQRFSQLLSEIEDQAVLLFALLFHDTWESEDDPNKLQTAANSGRKAATRIQMPAGDQQIVEFLIEHQATFYDAVSGRDLSDPATIRLLSENVGTIERLRLITALTYAEMSATYPEETIEWRLERLWQTYLATQRELTRELETDRIEEIPAHLPESADFIKGFPGRYLRARRPEEIAGDMRLYQLSRDTGVAVELEKFEGAYKLSVVAQDRPALFASFSGAISSFGLNIVKAEAFSNAKGVILDTFLFADPKRTLALNPPEAERLRDLIVRLALGKTDAKRLLRNRAATNPKQRGVEPQVQFDSEACETATLVQITAEDRPGLLYSLATVFSSNACNIDTVLIDTKGHRAMDVFYVARDGKKLSSGLQMTLKQQLLSACTATSLGN
jgi:[protein-PII] uridylyltransferase